MTLFEQNQQETAGKLKADGTQYKCRLVPRELLGETWEELGQRRIAVLSKLEKPEAQS